MKIDNITSAGTNQVPPSAPLNGDGPAPMGIDNIPKELKELGRFCFWGLTSRPGSEKPAKIPYNPRTGAPAKSTDPDTFGSFQDVREYDKAGYNGVGLGVFNNVAAIDIDHCVEAGPDGKPVLSEMAADIVNTMQGAYMEYSPSGTGVRILCSVPDGFVYDKSKYLINNQKLGLEVYVAGATSKYVSVTGNTWTPGVDLTDRGEQLQAVMDRYMRRNAPQPAQAQKPAQAPAHAPGQLQAEDHALIEAALNSANGAKVQKLLNGDMGDYDNDHSRADMALCCVLAGRTSDAEQIDRIVRSSGLMRPKWDMPNAGSTYGAITISKAIANAAEYREKSAVDIDPVLLRRIQEQQAQQTVAQAPAVQTVPQTVQQVGQGQPVAQAAAVPQAPAVQTVPQAVQQVGQAQTVNAGAIL